MATVATVARGAGARAAAAGLRGGGGTAARGRPRAGCARRLCTAPAAVDMKRYLWARYHEAKRSTDGECEPQPAPLARGPSGPSPYRCCEAPAETESRTWQLLLPCLSPALKAVSYLGIAQPGVGLGSALGRRESSKGVSRKMLSQTPLGVVIHPGNGSGSPVSCHAVLDRLQRRRLSQEAEPVSLVQRDGVG